MNENHASAYLLYGAYGYTGHLIARLAAERGHRPILAGRNEAKVAAVAAELALPHRAFGLDDPRALDRGLEGVAAVLHCAGPFEQTSRPMAEACLRGGVHYLDITGEAVVFEALAARGREAAAAGVMLLPGVGFDVVPTDCLAAHLKRRLPAAVRLALGIHGLGRLSRGTAATMAQNLHRGGLVRRGGELTPVPAAWKSRVLDFGRGPRPAVTIPWGDVATAWRSTAIPDIEVYMAAPPAMQRAMKATRLLRPLLALAPVRGFLKGWIRAGDAGPTDEERARGSSWVWGEVEDAEGRRAVSRLSGPEGYTWTALAALAIVEKVLAGQAPPGYQTPATACGADLVLEIPGVERRDEPIREPGAAPRDGETAGGEAR